jgi:hypothetical protein
MTGKKTKLSIPAEKAVYPNIQRYKLLPIGTVAILDIHSQQSYE